MRSESRSPILRWASGLLAGLTFVAAALMSATASASGAELVDRIVAIIDQEVITLSEAEAAERIGRLRLADPLSLREVVDRLIERRLVAREVARFSPEPVPDSQLEAALLDVRESFASVSAFESALEAYGLSEADLEEELREQLEVTRYLDKRFRALTYVSDAEVAAYYEDELLPQIPEGMPVPNRDDYVEEIRRILEERKFNDRVEQWIEELAARANIRRYVW